MSRRHQELVPLTNSDARYLSNLLDNATRSERQTNLSMRMAALCKTFEEAKAKEKQKRKAAPKKVIKPCTKYEWHDPVYVYQLKIRGTGEDEDQPATYHFSGSRQALAQPLIKLLEDTDYLENLEEELKEQLENWLSSNGWPQEVSEAEYSQYYREQVTDQLFIPEDVDLVCQACNDMFSNASFTIFDIELPRNDVLTRIQDWNSRDDQEMGKKEEEYSTLLDNSDTCLADIHIPGT